CDRPGVRGPRRELRRAERGRQPPGPPADRAGCGPGADRGAGPAPHRRDGGRHPRGGEGGRGLPADRPGASRRADRVRALRHRSLVNLVHHHRSGLVAAAGGGRLRVALTAAFSFDTSWEGPVLMADGHELHLIDDDVRRDPPALVDYVAEHGIEFLDLTPSYVQQLVSAGLRTDPRHPPKLPMPGGGPPRAAPCGGPAGGARTPGANFYG